MRIGIDGRVFVGTKTGIGHYVSQLCLALERSFPELEFFIYNRDKVRMPASSRRWTLRHETCWWRKGIKVYLWHKFLSGYFCRKDKIDIYWGAGTSLPFFLGTTHTVLTVYDLVYKLYPQTMYRYNLWIFRLFFKQDVRRASKITTISAGTAQRLANLSGRQADAIIHPSVAPHFSPQKKDMTKHCLKRYGIEKPYLLAVATWEPRKNLYALIKAYLLMRQHGELNGYCLVLVGGRGWNDQQLATLVTQNSASADIVSTGYVADQDMAAIYSGAAVFIFPSIYEGFGMPVLEAKRCGTPVITTDTPELREAGGEDCIYVRPTEEGICGGIRRFLSGDYSMHFAPLPHSDSWEAGAAILYEVFADGQ